VSNLTKKQIALTLVIVAFAAAMIVGTVASATSDNLAFAKHKHKTHHKHHKSHGDHNKSTTQSKSQTNNNKQTLICQASGGVSIGQGTGGIAGTGIAVTPNAGTNLCTNNNSNTNVDTGSQGATS
jgi:Ni/Co efflux regulator RcnB